MIDDHAYVLFEAKLTIERMKVVNSLKGGLSAVSATSLLRNAMSNWRVYCFGITHTVFLNRSEYRLMFPLRDVEN